MVPQNRNLKTAKIVEFGPWAPEVCYFHFAIGVPIILDLVESEA